MLYRILYFILSAFLLSSCSGELPEEGILVAEKKPFLIETEIIGNARESYTVEKSTRLTAGSALTLTAESLGEVSGILVKEGSKISKGMRLINLRDTVNSYDLRVAQAKNALILQDANIENTKVSLDKAVSDTQIGYEQAKRTYDTLIAKTNLSYDTIVNANQKTFDTLDANYKLYLAEIDKNIDQISYQSDQILGISTVFERANDNYESQLGARVGSLKVASDNSWGTVTAFLADIRAKKLKTITPETAQADIEMIEKSYTSIIGHIDDMIYMLQNNVISGDLSQERNNAWLALYSGYRSSVNGSNTAFTAWKNQILIFLKNYKLNELATKVAIESLTRELSKDELALIDKSAEAKLLYNNTILDIKDRISAAKLSLKQAQNARDTTVRTRETTLAQMGVGRAGGVISLEQVEREYAKLNISAPFDGTVSRVIATAGQRVTLGTPLIEVVSNLPELIIDLDAEIANALRISDSVSVMVGEKSFTGTVTAISRVAGNNLLYTTRVAVPRASLYIGTAAKVLFYLSREAEGDTPTSIALPLRAVKIISEQEGEISILGTSGTLLKKSVRLGGVSTDTVVIDDILERGLEVILSDISNFDTAKFQFQKK